MVIGRVIDWPSIAPVDKKNGGGLIERDSSSQLSKVLLLLASHTQFKPTLIMKIACRAAK
ncbi:MAG: hypothetical protein M3250_04830 [Thermoproteota archaeon]|nr:hypothetical protein [Thermoproteota archaeon]